MKKKYTEIICIIDRSGSMSIIRDATIKEFNDFLASQKQNPSPATVTLALFNSYITEIYSGRSLQDTTGLDREIFSPSGSTALHDAIGTTLTKERKRIAGLKKKFRPENVVVVILTDGRENASRKWTASEVKALIRELEEKDEWMIIYLSADKEIAASAAQINVVNTGSWSPTPSGIGNAWQATSYTVRNARMMGGPRFRASMKGMGDLIEAHKKRTQSHKKRTKKIQITHSN